MATASGYLHAYDTVSAGKARVPIDVSMPRHVTIRPNRYALKADLACGKRVRSEHGGRCCVGIERLAGVHRVCAFAASHRALGSSLVNSAIPRRA